MFGKPLKYYAKDLFAKDSYWCRKRRQKGYETIEAVQYKKNLLVKNYVIPLFGDICPAKITIKIVDEKLHDLNVSGRTKNSIITCLKEIYLYLVEEEIVKYSPIKDIVGFAKVTVNRRGALSIEEIDKLFPHDYAALLKIWGNELYACAFLILKDTGLRPGELRALQWKDWHADKRCFPITKAIESGFRDKIKGTKTGMNKPAIVSPFTAEYIEHFKTKSSHAKPDDFIFALKSGRPPKNEKMSKFFHDSVQRAGINRPEITPYWLRHTFNTRMLEVMPDYMVRKLMGHSTSAMTRHYRDADVNSILRDADKISEFLENPNENKNIENPFAENTYRLEARFSVN